MTREELENLRTLEHSVVCCKYLFADDGGVASEYFNYLLRNDKEFKDEAYSLRNKYYDKYQKKFSNIEINNYES